MPTRRTAQLESLAADLAEHAYPLARAATSAVAAEQQHRLAFGDRRHARDQFIAQLLLGAQANEDYLLRQAQIMGMDLSRPRAVILLDSGIDCSPEDVERVIRRIVQFFHLPNDTICGYLGANEVVVLKAASNRDLQSWTRAADPAAAGGASWANLRALKRAAGELATQLRRDGVRPAWIGVGRYHPGLPGLGLSYRDARAALALGPRYAPGRTVYALDEIGLGAWIGAFDETTRVDLAIRLVGPLDHSTELLETLDAFFAQDGSPSAAAARLAIHRNTLGYRLDRIRQLTGLDPRRFDDAIQLRLALLLRANCANAHDPATGFQPLLGR